MSIKPLFRKCLKTIDSAYAHVRSIPGRCRLTQSYVQERWDGDDPCASSNRVVIYVHYDKKGCVHDYVYHSVEQFAAAGLRVHFVSNARSLPGDAIHRLAPYCARIYRRKNVGHDFGAYRDVILGLADRNRLEMLLLTNDSVYGPFTSVERLLQKANPNIADVWGACDSWAIRYHLQSFFLVFHAPAISSGVFTKFWRSLPYVSYRKWMIRYGEVALTQCLLRAGLRCRALFPYHGITTRTYSSILQTRILESKLQSAHRVFLTHLLDAIEGGGPLNPTHHFWDLLIRDHGFPFIKRDLLQRNPIGVPGIVQWREIVGETGYDTQLIDDHLRLLARDHSV